ncbi:glycosyltransferase family 4 protein [Hymenobacter fastidiosus]
MLPLKVLILGWDEPAQAAGQSQPSAVALAHRLAPALTLAVLLPSRTNETESIPPTQIIGLGNLEPAAVALTERLPGAWRAPAAPYVGAGPLPPVAATDAGPEVSPPASPGPGAAAVPARRPLTAPMAGGELESDDEGGEPGPAEASALSQPEDDLTLVEPAADAAPAASSPAPTADQTTILQALASLRNDADAEADLNFRVIQYARLATPQAASQEFAVIYAADWPVWLAALEIRQRTGRPLVLHVHSLAADRDTPADRGWALELERLTLRRADLILAASAAVAERLQAVYNFPADRCRVVAPNDSHALHEVLNSFPPAA